MVIDHLQIGLFYKNLLLCYSMSRSPATFALPSYFSIDMLRSSLSILPIKYISSGTAGIPVGFQLPPFSKSYRTQRREQPSKKRSSTNKRQLQTRTAEVNRAWRDLEDMHTLGTFTRDSD